MIYGGSGSGKSSLAESLLTDADAACPRIYIATMNPTGEEARRRIRRHQATRRDKGFLTVERYTDVGAAPLPENAAVLLECLGNWLANEMFFPDGAGPDAVRDGIDRLRGATRLLLVVSNDVFSDGVSYPPETERYRTALAEINRCVAARCDTLIETVCGIPLYHKRDGVLC